MNALDSNIVKDIPDIVRLFPSLEDAGNDIYADSTYLSKLYGREHKAVTNSIDRILSRIPELSSDIIKSNYLSRGKLYPCYDMTRKGFEIVKLHFDFGIYISSKAKEDIVLSTIEQLQNIRIIRQHPIKYYRLDGYCIENNTAYEVDDSYHYEASGELKESCKKRQQDVQDFLGCSFVRIII